MIKKISVSILIFFTISICSFGQTGPNSRNFNNLSASVERIGTDLNSMPGVFNSGHLFTDSGNNLFVYSRDKKKILNYSFGNGYEKTIDTDIEFLITSQANICYAKQSSPA